MLSDVGLFMLSCSCLCVLFTCWGLVSVRLLASSMLIFWYISLSRLVLADSAPAHRVPRDFAKH